MNDPNNEQWYDEHGFRLKVERMYGDGTVEFLFASYADQEKFPIFPESCRYLYMRRGYPSSLSATRLAQEIRQDKQAFIDQQKRTQVALLPG